VGFQLIGEKVAKPDAVRSRVLPCFCWAAIESMKDEDAR
jgi:hypothetical protein